MDNDDGKGKGIIRVVAAIVVENRRVLVAQRLPKQSFPLLWEFPGGKLEPGETAAQALTRELMEELGITVRTEDAFDRVSYGDGGGRRFEVTFYTAIRTDGEPSTKEVAEVRWCDAAALATLPFIPSNKKVVERLVAELPGWGRG